MRKTVLLISCLLAFLSVTSAFPEQATNLRAPKTIQYISAQGTDRVFNLSSSFSGIMTTDTTYSIIGDGKISVYSFANNTLLKAFSLTSPGSTTISYHRSVNDGRLYFISCPKSEGENGTVQSINTETLEQSIVGNFSNHNFCDGTIIDARYTTTSEVVIRSLMGNFLFFTEKSGALDFTPPAGLWYGWVAVDFTSMSFYLHALNLGSGYYLSSFFYDRSSGRFVQKNSTKLNSRQLPYISYAVGDNKIFAARPGQLSITDLSSQKETTWSIASNLPLVSVVTDNANKSFAIVSESPLGNKNVQQTLMYDSGNLTPVPGSDKAYTGGSSGKCSYYLAEEVKKGLISVKIHNNCQNKQSIIY